ncbi:TPA: type 4b pilus protein PilO2 [Klebsiella oxytoca]|nr:type 4b pilus protein PilO2 [Klebsiella oxytoca]
MTVIPHGNGGLVAGLNWSQVTRKKTPRKARKQADAGSQPHLRPRDTLSVTLSPGRSRRGRKAAPATAPVTGTCPWQKGRLWSLAALAVAWTGPNGYGVVQISDDTFVFLATHHGVPALGGDICGPLTEMQAVTGTFLALTPAPADGWHVAAPPDTPAQLADVLPPQRRDWTARCRLTCPARTRQRVLFTLPVVLAAGLTAFQGLQSWRLWSAEQARLAQQKLAAMVPLTEPEPEKRYLPHPWAELPAPLPMLRLCEQALSALPLHPGHWQLTEAGCRSDGVMASWQRPDSPLATVASLRQALALLPGAAVPFFDDDGNTAHSAHPLPEVLPAGGDEPVHDHDVQRLMLLTFFQSRGNVPALSEVSAEGLPENTPETEGVIWIQDWQAQSFSHSAPLPPSIQLAGLPLRGLRLTTISLKPGDAGMTWTTDATVYGRNPDVLPPAPQAQEEGDAR